eukprot:SAG31_NODE_694_length_12769_cov_8.102447_9_plen_71_part_00
MKDHVRRAAILGGICPQLGVPLHRSVAAIVADVTLAIRAPIVLRIAALSAVGRQVGGAACVTCHSVLYTW